MEEKKSKEEGKRPCAEKSSAKKKAIMIARETHCLPMWVRFRAKRGGGEKLARSKNRRSKYEETCAEGNCIAKEREERSKDRKKEKERGERRGY